MDYSDEPPLCRFGTPLDPLEEEDVPSKKPVAIEDQIVTDENGRRRFHGAFTGGFSAGFWNTVGSLEGWKPQSFKSSRSEKAEKRQSQVPTDFMDDEDLGEFGIAPQRVQAREDFAKGDDSSSNRKRKLRNIDSGPIPGVPVLQQLLEPAREKVAVRLLRRMGWKPGQGIGARQTRKEKTRSNERNNRELYVMKMYGCSMKPDDKSSHCRSEQSQDESEDEEEEDLTFAPDDFEPFVCSVKDNTFGLGYSGLSRQVAGETHAHINLFGPLEVLGKSNKKLSITGQAFGVGALEEEDEDIYARDDMSKYDFSLSDKRKREKKKLGGAQEESVLEGFSSLTVNSSVSKTVHKIDLKSNFQPRNWLQRKTRFEPLPEEKAALITQDAFRKRGLGRHDLGPDERGKMLDGLDTKTLETKQEKEDSKKSYLQHINQKYKEREDKNRRMLELLSSKADNFVKGGLITNTGDEIAHPAEVEVTEDVKCENQKILSDAKQITKSLGDSTGLFRPFASNEAKQERYEKFVEANLKQDEEIKAFLLTIQPVHLSEWDREMERKEFMQARSIYKPLNGLMSERFVSKSTTIVEPKTSKAEIKEKVNVVVERQKSLWKPCALICKRFNIPEPFGGTLVEPKVPKKNKFSVFDYIENSINSKKDFVTPVIIPKHIEKPKPIQVQKEIVSTGTESVSAKEMLPPDKDEETASVSKAPEHVKPTKPQVMAHTKKPKTELELRVEEGRNKHPSEKKDLFKSIFDSSSDDSEDEAKEDDTSDPPTVVTTEIAQSLIKPTAPVNILRNNSPPRGVFAALFSKPPEPKEEAVIKESSVPEKITFQPQKRLKDTPLEDDGTYGPKVPETLKQKPAATKDNDIDKKLAELLSANPAKKIIETWVEKTSKSPKKSKKSKKEKKKKDRKEKHKKSKKKSKK